MDDLNLQTIFGARLQKGLYQLHIMQLGFGTREFTRQEFKEFYDEYSTYSDKYGYLSDEQHNRRGKIGYGWKVWACKLLTLTNLVKNNIVKVVREEPAGRGKRYFYQVNDNFFNEVIEEHLQQLNDDINLIKESVNEDDVDIFIINYVLGIMHKNVA